MASFFMGALFFSRNPRKTGRKHPAFLLLGGFLGAGKTTCLVALAEWLIIPANGSASAAMGHTCLQADGCTGNRAGVHLDLCDRATAKLLPFELETASLPGLVSRNSHTGPALRRFLPWKPAAGAAGWAEEGRLARKMTSFRRKAASFQGKVASFRGNLVTFAGNLPSFGPDLPSFGQNLATFPENLPSFRGNLATFAGNLPSFDQNLATFWENLPSFFQKEGKFRIKEEGFPRRHEAWL